MTVWSAFWLGFAMAAAIIAMLIVWHDSLPITEIGPHD